MPVTHKFISLILHITNLESLNSTFNWACLNPNSWPFKLLTRVFPSIFSIFCKSEFQNHQLYLSLPYFHILCINMPYYLTSWILLEFIYFAAFPPPPWSRYHFSSGTLQEPPKWIVSISSYLSPICSHSIIGMLSWKEQLNISPTENH